MNRRININRSQHFYGMTAWQEASNGLKGSRMSVYRVMIGESQALFPAELTSTSPAMNCSESVSPPLLLSFAMYTDTLSMERQRSEWSE